MSKHLIRYGCDILLWAGCVFAIGFLEAAGLIEDRTLALAGAALFWAIRANTKADVNAVSKNSVEG